MRAIASSTNNLRPSGKHAFNGRRRHQDSFLLIFLAALLWAAVVPAEPIWRILPEAPDRGPGGRHEDVFFLDEYTGWVCNLAGQIWKTTNGGASWDLQLDIPEAFRSITFVDSQRGWAGSVFNVNLLWETFDGGENWGVVPSIPEPRPAGICALWPIDSNVIYGCGKYSGPASLIKTVNGGTTWTTIDLSAYATTLVDCHFTSADSGFVVGGVGEFLNLTKAIVLFTADGGATWDVRWQGSRTAEWGWKISFPTPDVGYVSLETNNTHHWSLKTVNGGQTWTERFFGSGSNRREQGIGFANTSLGWLGGSPGLAFETIDGGQTWLAANWGNHLNRVFMLSETMGYAVGQTVYKYSQDDVTDVAERPSSPPPEPIVLHQNAPNPFNPTTTIRYVIEQDATIRLMVFDVQGKMVRKLVDQLEQAGEHVVLWDGRDNSGQTLASGLYYYRLESDTFAQVRKMTLLK
jgi:photosystem II stability/assembly factor-like uncharacterized protein